MSNAQIERRMELVRVVSHNTHKRMVSCLQGHVGADAEKRHVRLQTCYSETLNKAPLYPLKMKLNSVRTRPSVYDLSFVFSTPPPSSLHTTPKMHNSPYHASIQEMVR